MAHDCSMLYRQDELTIILSTDVWYSQATAVTALELWLQHNKHAALYILAGQKVATLCIAEKNFIK